MVSWASSNAAVATVANSTITAHEVGSTLITVTTDDGNYTATCTVLVIIPEWVEINGVKWATRNVNMPGTFAAKPEDVGMVYQWNRKTGWSSTEPMISSDGGTTWDGSFPTGDSWKKANDPCPVGWRVPALWELQSLIASGIKWTTENGVNGLYFGADNQIVFFPATDYRSHSNGSLQSTGGYEGIYWSATPSPSYDEGAYGMSVYNEHAYTSSYYRSTGLSVRCVVE